MLIGLHPVRHPACPQHLADGLDGVLPFSGPAVAPPAGQLALARQDHAEPQRLGGQTLLQRSHLRGRRSPVNPQDRGGPWRARARAEHQAHLVQRDVGEPAPDITGKHPQQPWQQRGAQQRLLLGERVGQPDSGPPRIIARQLQPVEVRGGDEWLAQHLDVANVRQRPADRPAQPLRGGQSPPGGGTGHPGRDVLVSLQPDDLLGEVAGVDQVRPPGWRDHRERLRAGLKHLASHVPQPAHDRVVAVDLPGHPVGVIVRDGDRDGRHLDAGVRAARHHAGPAERGEQRDRLGRRPQREFPVHPPLEPVGRLAEQPVPPAHPRGPGRREVGRLDDQVP